jgi:hypothetical protein
MKFEIKDTNYGLTGFLKSLDLLKAISKDTFYLCVRKGGGDENEEIVMIYNSLLGKFLFFEDGSIDVYGPRELLCEYKVVREIEKVIFE